MSFSRNGVKVLLALSEHPFMNLDTRGKFLRGLSGKLFFEAAEFFLCAKN